MAYAISFYYRTILSNNVSGASSAEHFSGKSRKRCASEKASIYAEILIMSQKKTKEAEEESNSKILNISVSDRIAINSFFLLLTYHNLFVPVGPVPVRISLITLPKSVAPAATRVQ